MQATLLPLEVWQHLDTHNLAQPLNLTQAWPDPYPVIIHLIPTPATPPISPPRCGSSASMLIHYSRPSSSRTRCREPCHVVGLHPTLLSSISLRTQLSAHISSWGPHCDRLPQLASHPPRITGWRRAGHHCSLRQRAQAHQLS